jgi:hypothetical protein
MDLEVDEEAFVEFITCLQPIIGNLREVHDGYARDKDLPVVTPMICFTVESWSMEDQ